MRHLLAALAERLFRRLVDDETAHEIASEAFVRLLFVGPKRPG
jgi:hypothetical protein